MTNLLGRQDSAADWIFLAALLALAVGFLIVEARALRSLVRLCRRGAEAESLPPIERSRDWGWMALGALLLGLALLLTSRVTCAG